jgi:hypothetical protein
MDNHCKLLDKTGSGEYSASGFDGAGMSHIRTSLMKTENRLPGLIIASFRNFQRTKNVRI